MSNRRQKQRKRGWMRVFSPAWYWALAYAANLELDKEYRIWQRQREKARQEKARRQSQLRLVRAKEAARKRERATRQRQMRREAVNQWLDRTTLRLTLRTRLLTARVLRAYRIAATEYRKAHHRANRDYVAVLDAVKTFLARARMLAEGVLERLRFTVIGNTVRTRDKQTYVLVDPWLIDPERVGLYVDALADLGAEFRIIDLGLISQQHVARHLEWVKSQAARNRWKLKKYAPKATLDYDAWLGWYVDNANFISAKHRFWRPYLVLPTWCLNSIPLRELVPAVMNRNELKRYLVNVFDQDSDRLDTAWRELEERLVDETSTLDAITPDTIDFSDDGVICTKRSLDGETIRQTHFTTVSVLDLNFTGTLEMEDLDFRGTEWLREKLLAVVSGERRIFITTTVKPQRNNKRHLGLELKKVNAWRRAIKKRGLGKLTKAQEKHYKMVSSMVDTIKRGPSPPRAASVRYTVVLKTISEEDLVAFTQEVKQILEAEDEDLLLEWPNEWDGHESNYRTIFPCIFAEDTAKHTVPAAMYFLKSAFFYPGMPVAQNGVLLGYLAKDMTPIVETLGIYLDTGSPDSGKTGKAKNLAVMGWPINPGNKLYIVDNISWRLRGAETVKGVAQQKGWVDIVALFGGEVIYSDDYATPLDLYRKLVEIQEERVILYYPSKHKPSNDMAYLDWLLDVFQFFGRPEEYGKGEFQAIAIFDELAGWLTPGNELARHLVQDVLVQGVGNGVLCELTVQGADLAKYSDPAAHSLLVDICNSVFLFQTQGLWKAAESIGIVSSSPNAVALQRSIESILESISGRGIGTTERPGWCAAVFRNVVAALAKVHIHDDLLPLISRRVVRPQQYQVQR